MSEWQECTLGEFVESVSETYKFKSKEQVVFLNTSDILFGKVTNRLRQDSSNLPGQAKKRIKKGDFLFSEIRPANGRYAVIDFNAENYVVSTKLMVLRCNNGINRDYFRIFLTSKEQLDYLQLLAEDRSGTFPQITFDHISNLNISLPPLPEQKAIASVLSSLDDKIDLLHRQNKTLEAMAETLFRQWFVEKVEDDWKEGTISDLIEFNPARKLAKGEIAPYLEMAALSTNTFNPDGWYPREFSSGTKFINGDTLLARITPCLENGKTAYITFLEDEQVAWGSTEYIVMRPKGNLHPFFAYSLARNSDFRDYAEGCLAGSSGRQRVDIDHLKDYKINIPSATRIKNYNAFAESITPKLHANSQQIRTLETLRDTLLPKLMSGEVRVTV